MNNLDEMIKLVNSIPMLYVFATASRLAPNTAAENVLTDSRNDIDVIESYDLIPIHKSGTKQSIKYDDDYLKSASGNFTCICPFHNDATEGSLVITSNLGIKNIWKCFACGAGSDAINFEMNFFNLKFKDAVFHLAYRMGFIDEQSMKSKTSNGIDVKAVKKHQSSVKKHVEMDLADEDVISNVYKAMQKLYPLTEGHKKHLKSVRGLSENDFWQYFSFPARNTNVAREIYELIVNEQSKRVFSRKLDELSEDEAQSITHSDGMLRLKNQLHLVPGFYKNARTGKVEWLFKNGLALLAIDDLGFVRGIQVQKMDNNAKGPKYVWWSSQVKLGEPGFEGGSTAGSPGGVIFPKDPYHVHGQTSRDDAPIVITEGKYKAEALARQGRIAIYVSGVSTWKNIIPMIERLKGHREKIYVAFDADSLGNTAVKSQLEALCLQLKEIKLTPILLLWSKALGKGFDDLLLNKGFVNYKYFMKAMRFDDFEVIYSTESQKLLNTKGVDAVSKLPDDEKVLFGKVLQMKLESALNLPTVLK